MKINSCKFKSVTMLRAHINSVTERLNIFSSIKYLMLVRLACGNYVELSSSKTLNNVVRLYCALCVYITITFITDPVFLRNIWFYIQTGIIVFEYLIGIGLSIITKQEHLIEYYTNLKIFDSFLKANLLGYNSFSYKLLLVLVAVTKMLGIIAVLVLVPSTFTLSSFFITTGSLMNYLHITWMFDMFRVRMRLVRECAGALESDASAADKLRCVRRCVHRYSMLLGTFNRAADAHKVHVFINLLCTFTYNLFCIYGVAVYLISGGSLAITVVGCLHGIMAAGVTFTPCVLAELACAECERLVVLLADQLLLATDTNLWRALWEALDYLEARPAVTSVWRAYRLDVQLVLSLVSLCTTYVIVMTQFSV